MWPANKTAKRKSKLMTTEKTPPDKRRCPLHGELCWKWGCVWYMHTNDGDEVCVVFGIGCMLSGALEEDEDELLS